MGTEGESAERQKSRNHERRVLESRASQPDEDSAVHEQRALERAEKSDSSIPPRGRFLLRLISLVPAGQRWVVLLALIALLAFVLWRVGPALLSKVGL